jgi:hypothetical protein
MYKVVIWDTKEVIAEFSELKDAKRVARRQGSQECNISTTGYEPRAYVGVEIDGRMCVEYNPRFTKLVEATPVLHRRTEPSTGAKSLHGIGAASNARTQLKNWHM